MIVYVGGNKDGNDGKYFMTQCPKCKIHIFEPVPDFNKDLEKTWTDLIKKNNWSAQIHKYGLGKNVRYECK